MNMKVKILMKFDPRVTWENLILSRERHVLKPKTAKWNHRNETIEATETSETKQKENTETKGNHRNKTKPLKWLKIRG